MCRGGRECRVFGCKQSDAPAVSSSTLANNGQEAPQPCETVVCCYTFRDNFQFQIGCLHPCVGRTPYRAKLSGTAACVCWNMYMAKQHVIYDYISDSYVYFQDSDVPDGLSQSVSGTASSVFVGDADASQEKANDKQHNVQVCLS